MKKIVIFLCFFWMGFIFYMSSNNGEISHQKSDKVIQIIKNVKEELPNKEDEELNKNQNITNFQDITAKQLDFIIRKNAHGFMYMILAVLVAGMLFTYNKRGIDAISYILFICLFYAVTDEFHQGFVPGRTSLVSDVLIDFVGSLVGLALFYLMYYKIYIRFFSKKNILR